MLVWLPDLVAATIAVALCLLCWRAVCYARQTNRPMPPASGRRAFLFGAGILVYVLAFSLPGQSVLPQMVEHVLLAFAVPPLLLLGVPKAALLPLFEHRRSRRTLRAFTRPSHAAVLFLGVLFLWYFPRLFEQTLASPGLRLAAGLSILLVATFFWWPIIEPFPAWEQELADLGKLLYLFIGSSVLKVLGFILAIVPRPIYQLPAHALPAWGLTPLSDQQDAGWLMVLAGTFVLLGAATIVCVRMFQDPDEANEAVYDWEPDTGMRG
jgi:cytochrome c oxidase assembly factor CtaG